MKKLALTMVFFVITLCGCETQKLWSDDSNNYYLQIVSQKNNQDVEEELKSSGKTYYCNRVFGENPQKTCYVKTKKDILSLSNEVGVKLFKTPKTLAIDTGKTIMVVGYFVIAIESSGTSGVQGSIH